MLESFLPRLLLGTLLGFLSGIGIGGGSLLVLWLTAVTGTSPETARTVNLLFFLPAAFAALYFRKKQGILEFKPLLPAIAAGCISAGIFSRIAMGLNTGILKKAFGVLLIFTGIRELLYKKKKAS